MKEKWTEVRRGKRDKKITGERRETHTAEVGEHSRMRTERRKLEFAVMSLPWHARVQEGCVSSKNGPTAQESGKILTHYRLKGKKQEERKRRCSIKIHSWLQI